jgi:hypothetical protein
VKDVNGGGAREKCSAARHVYWLNFDQARHARAYGVMAGLHEHLSAVDLAERLRFLMDCHERTILGQNPMLGRLIEDYRIALRDATQHEEARSTRLPPARSPAGTTRRSSVGPTGRG